MDFFDVLLVFIGLYCKTNIPIWILLFQSKLDQISLLDLFVCLNNFQLENPPKKKGTKFHHFPCLRERKKKKIYIYIYIYITIIIIMIITIIKSLFCICVKLTTRQIKRKLTPIPSCSTHTQNNVLSLCCLVTSSPLALSSVGFYEEE